MEDSVKQSKQNILDELAGKEENQLTAEQKRHLDRKAIGKSRTPQADPRIQKSENDSAIELAEIELKKSGVTLYGNQGPIKLTPLEHKFTIGYVKSGTVKDAMKFTGYEGKNWSQIGYQLLNKPEVAQAISVIEKQHILASGLTELEVISGIRTVTQLAQETGKFAAALKGYYVMGEYLDMWGTGKKSAGNGKQVNITHNNLTINQAANETFGTSGEKKDIINDIQRLSQILNIPMGQGKPEVIKDITGETILKDTDEE